jgi:hypothetical protein
LRRVLHLSLPNSPLNEHQPDPMAFQPLPGRAPRSPGKSRMAPLSHGDGAIGLPANESPRGGYLSPGATSYAR